MSTELDLRSPTIVVVGRWNDAILNEPGWVAKHILQRPEGEQVEVRAFIRQENGAPTAHVWSYTGFAMSCMGLRLELFQNSKDDLAIYEVLSRISDLLPHTPVSGLGVNFKITSDDEIVGVTEALETEEAFDAIGVSKILERSDTIEITKGQQLDIKDPRLQQCRLKLSRVTDFSTIVLDFNFHQDISSMKDVSDVIAARPIEHWAAMRDRILSECYGIEQFNEKPF